MNSAFLQYPESVEWRLTAPPAGVRMPRAVLESIHQAATAAFLSFPGGGLETGGVLFGVRQGAWLEILDWKPIPCSHSAGPAFQLSPQEQDGLAALLQEWAARPGDRKTEPLGWFHTHNRSELSFTEEDETIHRRFFPSPWQVALVLRPQYTSQAEAVFYRLSEDGTFRPASEVFHLPPAGARVRASRDGRTEGETQGSARARRAALRRQLGLADESPVDFGSLLEQRAAARAAMPVPGAGDANRQCDTAPGSPVQPPLIPSIRTAPEPPEELVQGTAPARRPPPGDTQRAWPVGAGPDSASAVKVRTMKRLGWLAAAMILVLAAAAGWQWLQSGRPWGTAGAAKVGERQPLALHLEPAGSFLRVTWNPEAAAVREASAASLRITDGGDVSVLPLTASVLSKGFTVYVPKSEDVLVRLVLVRPGKPLLEESALFLGKLPSGAESGSGGAEPVNPSPVEDVHPQKAEFRPTAPSELTAARPNAPVERSLTPGGRVQQTAQKPERTESMPQPVRPAPAPLSSVPPPGLAQAPPAAAAAAGAAARTPLRRGRMIWTGLLPPGQELTISTSGASAGLLAGNLPGTPVNVGVYPGEFVPGGLTLLSADAEHAAGESVEAPRAENQWTRLRFRYAPDRARSIQILEAPSAANNWQTLRIRNTGGALTALVVSWEAH